MSMSRTLRNGQLFLLHPELRDKTPTYLILRSTFPLMYFFPVNERISWYGDVNMYCTEPQYAAIGSKPDPGDIRVGPF